MLSHPFELNHSNGSQTRRRNQPNILLFLSSYMYRLPILIVWTLIVIFVLYRSADSGEETLPSTTTTTTTTTIKSDSETSQTTSFDLKHILQARLSLSSDRGDSNQDRHRPEIGSKVVSRTEGNTNPLNDDYGSENGAGSESIARSTQMYHEGVEAISSNRKPIENYVRQSGVFILMIQNDAPNYKKRIKILSNDAHFNSDDKQHLPAHIELLIAILRSHRISFTLDTSSARDGLPAALLNSRPSQYSVIVVDDFVSYTQMNRWQRDQLDRLCRTHQIGVIAYLTARSYELSQRVNLNRFVQQSARSKQHLSRRDVDDAHTTGTDESPEPVQLSDQFPLAFKPLPFDGADCADDRRPNRTGKNDDSCLVDYEVNGKLELLRILKRGENIVLHGPVDIDNSNSQSSDLPDRQVRQTQRVAMSSNHITYEPIAWAKRVTGSSNNKRQAVRRIKRRATIPLASTADQVEPLLVADERPSGEVRVSPTPTSKSPMSVPITAATQAHGSGNERERITGNGFASTGTHGRSIDEHSSEAASSGRRQRTGNNGNNMATQIGADAGGKSTVVLSMLDRGLYDGIKRVIFGSANEHWLERILLLDAVEHLSNGRILTPLDRYVQIDIDDVFVGERGKRMTAGDVDALMATQRRFAKLIGGGAGDDGPANNNSSKSNKGFRFNLGFSGRFFRRGTDQEVLGDERLLELAGEFNWFCHFWAHTKAHLFGSADELARSALMNNVRFAREHNIPLAGTHYAVAPHHSGVYPVHEPLYDAWRALNVQVTSTEEYPHLRPANARRAFVHRGIQVLPRQTCGLYTHTIWRRYYPGGFSKLQASINGGELFETVLHNPVNIYMTHMSNYGNDRLAPYTFGALIDFVRKYTNLQLKYADPAEMGQIYFSLFPDEKSPLWTNPCDDRRHLAIWADSKHYLCNYVPKVLIVGPQKTGTTALYTFLKMSPLFRSAQMSPEDFEEVQFFNDKHYAKGSDWYMSRFAADDSDAGAGTGRGMNASKPDQVLYFDKSATYFDDPKVPERASSLLPDARIIMLLIDPADRAYSWYQHIRAHGDVVASRLTFDQLILDANYSFEFQDSGITVSNNYNATTLTSTESTTRQADELHSSQVGVSDAPLSANAIRRLRNRCIQPGYYAQHLVNWLEHYSSRQIIIIDGQWFKYNPAAVMNKLQLLLGVRNPLDYNQMLAFDLKKGFYCPLDVAHNSSSRTRCLGKSKGRKYEPMSEEARHYLNRLYLGQNRQLARLLNDIGQPLPTWLDAALDSVAQLASASDRQLSL